MMNENLILLLVEDVQTPSAWMERWAVSYPCVRHIQCNAQQSTEDWQSIMNEAVQQSEANDRIFIAALGSGVAAVAAWYDAAHIMQHRRLAGMILASPDKKVFVGKKNHVLLRCRFSCKTALVVGQNDEDAPSLWAKDLAEIWQARFFTAPHKGSLRHGLNQWAWGMQLMQEMLMDD